MTIPDALSAFWVGFCIVAVIAILMFGAVKCESLPNEMQVCTESGGSWVVSDNTKGDYADYECQM